MVARVGRLAVRSNTTAELGAFVEHARETGECFVPTDDAPDLDAMVELEVWLGRLSTVLRGVVLGLEVDAAGRPGVRLALRAPALETLSDFARAHGLTVRVVLEEEPTTNPMLAGAPDGVTAITPEPRSLPRISAPALVSPTRADPPRSHSAPRASNTHLRVTATVATSLGTDRSPFDATTPDEPSAAALSAAAAPPPASSPLRAMNPGSGTTPALARPSFEETLWNEHYANRFLELNAAVPPEVIDRCARARLQLPPSMPAAWVLAAAWVGLSAIDDRAMLVRLLLSVVLPSGGALDRVDEHGATVIFFGLGAQGASALAAQSLRESLEALAEDRPGAPSIKLALVASRLQAAPQRPVTGEGMTTVRQLLERSQAGQCLVPRPIALGVSDLLTVEPVGEDDVRLASRRPLASGPVVTVGLEAMQEAFGAQLEQLRQGALVSAFIVAGERRAGRTHLAQELARQAHSASFVVAFSSSRALSGTCASLVELVCHACDTPVAEQGRVLREALLTRGCSLEAIEGYLAATLRADSPLAFTPRQAAEAVRTLIGQLAKGQPRVLVVDGLDQADERSAQLIGELLRRPVTGELWVVTTTPAQLTALDLTATTSMRPLSPASVDVLLLSMLGHTPAELRETLIRRSRGLTGVLVELLLLTLSRGAVRPRGERLELDGVVPAATDETGAERVDAEGARVKRVLEVVLGLGAHADAARVAQVLPASAREAWPRAVAARLLVGISGRPSVPSSVHAAVMRTSSAALAGRVASVLSTLTERSPATEAQLADAFERSRAFSAAASAWKVAAEGALADGALELARRAQAGLLRVLDEHPQRASGAVLQLRQQLAARITSSALARQDVTEARLQLDRGLALVPPVARTELELTLAQARVLLAETRTDEAHDVLALAVRETRHPVHGALLAELASALEQRRSLAEAQDAWHRALAAAGPFLPLAPWHGEVDFRARVEARIGALFVALKQPTRARSWLVSAAQRFTASRAPRFAARVQADLGTLCLQLVEFDEAAQWFEHAATSARSGGDSLFEARQLVWQVDVAARRGDRAAAAELTRAAAQLATRMGWAEAPAMLRAHLR